MSNYMSNGDAVQVFGTYANSIKAATPTEITYAQYQQLTPEQIANGNYMVSDWAGSLTAVAHVYHGKVVGGSGGGDVSGKADKVSGATSGNFAGLDANGNLTDSGHKHSDYLTSHQDISGKADKPSTATTGNFASFDANKNPVDSGKKASDFIEKSSTSGLVKNDGTIDTNTYSKNFSGTDFFSGSGDYGGHDANNLITNGHYYYTSNGPSTSIGASTNDGALYVQAYSSSWVVQIAQDYRNGNLFVRAKSSGTWTAWKCVTSTALNRSTAVNAADTNYTTAMARGIYATTSDLTPGSTALTNGTIALVYE